VIIEHESLHCTSCKETFVINWIQSPEGETNYVGFDFTCVNRIISIKYAEDHFELKNWGGKCMVVVPPFEVDFSDKKKLQEKLQTYVIFS
jgi:hypothetical protein